MGCVRKRGKSWNAQVNELLDGEVLKNHFQNQMLVLGSTNRTSTQEYFPSRCQMLVTLLLQRTSSDYAKEDNCILKVQK